MSSKKQPETNKEQKIQTKYDRKMEERRLKEERDKKEARILRIGAIVLAIAIIAAIAGSITFSVLSKRAAVKEPYITVGNHPITKVEYDYYYNSTVNNYLASYASILSYIGYDTEKAPENQQYSEDMTWKDMFDQMTVGQIQQTKALLDDAAANGFTYDGTEDYETTLSSIKSGAEAAGSSLLDYYRKTYGKYATEKNIAPFLKEAFLAAAYSDELLAKNAPGDDEIKAYYEENKKDYDRVDYRSFAFTADVAQDAAEEDIERQMLEAEKKAKAMMAAREAGGDFETLCLDNAPEDEKANYEAADSEYSFTQAQTRSGVPGAISEWLYEDGRKEGDITVLEDETYHRYYVVEFVNRYYDEADNETISNTIASDRVTEYITKLVEGYTVTDNKGEMAYLKTAENRLADTEDTAETSESVAEDVASTGETAETGTEGTEGTEEPAEAGAEEAAE